MPSSSASDLETSELGGLYAATVDAISQTRWVARPAKSTVPPNMALQRTRRPRFRSGRSLRSLGSPLNAQPLGGS